MNLFALLAILVAVTSASQVFNQLPGEVYQTVAYHHAQNQQQSKGFSQGYDGGFQVSDHQLVQSIQHQPAQHPSIQNQHRQTFQPQHVQFQSHDGIQNQPQHVQYQNHEEIQSQPQNNQIQSHDGVHSQPQQIQFQSHEQIQSQPQHIQFQSHEHIQSVPQHIHLQSQSDNSHIGQLSSPIGHGSQQHSVENNLNRQAKILNYQHDFDEHNYQYAYETENGIKAQEVGTTHEGTKAEGAYSYTGDDGQVYTVTYTADENGFHASGAHLPTPPPIPEAIARSIEHNLRNEANGVVDDGQYHEQDHDQHIQQSQRHQQKQKPTHGLLQQLQRDSNEQTSQPSYIVHQQQIPEQQQQHQQKQTQEPSLKPVQLFQKQNLVQVEPQVLQLVQPINHQHQQPIKFYQQLQRKPKPIHLKQHHVVSLARQPNVVMQQILPHIEQQRHVEYVIPSVTRSVRGQRTDDYLGPAPTPVTETQYRH